MFAIKRVVIRNEDRDILNIQLFDSKPVTTCGIYTTLILGENGVGKSFLLKSIIDIFRYLENAKAYKRKPKYQYKDFQIEYILNDIDYYVHRESGSIITATKDGIEIDYRDIEIPNRMLALSFMVNDKFPWQKDDESNMYFYHGVRSSTNSTYTSSLDRSIAFDIFSCIRQEAFNQLSVILSILKFDSKIVFEKKRNGVTEQELVFDLSAPEKIDFSKYNKWYYPDVYFYKSGKKLPFGSCSSGEKHLLFAYLGILSRIKDNSLILIDEPEISLHPEWQIRYISSLKKIFGCYKNCCYILASHSHYFVSELQGESSSIIVLKENDRGVPQAKLIPYDTYSWSAENIIYNVFGIRTARNYYFECDLSDLIQSLEAFDHSEEMRLRIESRISKLRKYVFHSNDPLSNLLDEAEERIRC